MKNITLQYSEQLLKISEIELLEAQNNFKIVQSYKQFLLKNNGGVPKENVFWDGELEMGVSYFYPLKYGEHTIEEVIENIHREDALPKEYFPFASTGGGSIYAFSMLDDNFGEVYLFHFDGSEPFKVTNSFEEFIGYLEE